MPATSYNDVSLEYTDTGGSGKPVVLVHGFPLNGRMWESQVEALSDRFRVLVPDLKGFGSSDAPTDRSSYSMDSYAEEVNAVMDDAGVQRAALVGLSMGGYVCLAFMRRHPERASALVLADTRAEADPPEGVDKRTAQQQQVEAEGTAALIDALTSALLSDKTKADKPEVVERVKAVMDNPPAGFVGALEAMKNRPDSTPGLPSIGVPVLVVVGEKDPLTPPEVARTLYERLAGSEMVVLPEAGHLASLEMPNEFNAALRRFLEENA